MNEGMQNLIEIDELENKVYQYKLKEKKMRQLISNVFWDLKRDINKGMNIEDIYWDVGYMSSLCVMIGKKELGQKINDKFIQQKGRLIMKKYKVYCEDLGYEQIVEADNDEDAISMGYDEVSNNLHEYVEININEIKESEVK